MSGESAQKASKSEDIKTPSQVIHIEAAVSPDIAIAERQSTDAAALAAVKERLYLVPSESLPPASLENLPAYETARELIDEIDFATLKNIFDELRQKSGVTTPSDFVSSEKIVIDQVDGAPQAGTYTPGKIYLNPFRAREDAVSKEDFARKIISVLIHEETHASAGNKECSGNIADGIKQVRSYFTQKLVITEQSGYARKGYEKGDFRLKSNCFNEGVTDLIAEDVYKEYLQRSGQRLKFTGASGDGNFFESYVGARFFLTVFIEKIAQTSNVPYEKVREALTQGYMSGLDLGQTEVASLFDDVFYPGCLTAIESAWKGDIDLPLAEILKTVDFKNFDGGSAERMKNSFDKFIRQLDKFAAQSQHHAEMVVGLKEDTTKSMGSLDNRL